MMEARHPDSERHLNLLRSLRQPSGLFLASAQSVSTGYDKAWLRDNFYIGLAFERAEDWDTLCALWRAVLAIFLKHEDKITQAVAQKPHESWQYIHARYNPETFEEYWEEWGNKQNDAIGAVLFMLGRLEKQGHGVIFSEDDRRVVQKLVEYLSSLEYWHDPDNGMWEEHEEVHASSIGAVVGGLKEVANLPFITIPEGLIQKGEEALAALLPRESEKKFCDLALLSLLYPYAVLSSEQEREILGALEYHLARARGVVRYKNDHYYNANKDGWSEEAEWTMGLPWLSIIYARRGEQDKAREYLARARAVCSLREELPELYFSNSERFNENVPLGWAQSLFAVALAEVEGG